VLIDDKKKVQVKVTCWIAQVGMHEKGTSCDWRPKLEQHEEGTSRDWRFKLRERKSRTDKEVRCANWMKQTLITWQRKAVA